MWSICLPAMLEQEGGLAPSILLRADVPLETLHRRLIQEIEKLPKVSGAGRAADQVYVTNRLSQLLTRGGRAGQAAERRVRFDRASAAGDGGRSGRGWKLAARFRADPRPADEGAGRGARATSA